MATPPPDPANHTPGRPHAPAGTQAVRRAAAVLDLFMTSEHPLPVGKVAHALGLSSGTASRLVGALVAEGYLQRSPGGESFHLGPKAVLMGQVAGRFFGLDRATPVLEGVHSQCDESVNLTVRDGGESVVMLRWQSTLPLRFEQHAGARFPLYTTAAGKAMLAHDPDASSYLAALPRRLPTLTSTTLASPDELSADLERTRTRGYSIDNQENVEGVRCVGAPVLDLAGRAHAAVVIQVPTVRMSRPRQSELARLAVDAAAEITRLLPADRQLRR
ncbi:IclR family transcriptional regulator [Janibacter sp. GS2]|uniref:IclR family transcriptional regulator n=1 Tax=Janibacter sp. GS2 TaxID=3442646 RepID=UPI003EBC21B5